MKPHHQFIQMSLVDSWISSRNHPIWSGCIMYIKFAKFWDIPISNQTMQHCRRKNISWSSLWDIKRKKSNFTPNLHMNKCPNHHLSPRVLPKSPPEAGSQQEWKVVIPKMVEAGHHGFFRDDEGTSRTFKGCPAPYQDEPSLEIRSILRLFVKGSWRLPFLFNGDVLWWGRVVLGGRPLLPMVLWNWNHAKHLPWNWNPNTHQSIMM